MESTMEQHFCEFLHLRLTTSNTKEQITTLVGSISTGRYIIACENESSNQHYHAAFFTQLSRKQIKEELNVLGYTGNKSFSLTKVKDDQAVKKYVVKDGDFWYKGFTEKEINDCYQLSYKKSGFKQELESLEEKYLTCEMDFETFGVKYIQLKAAYNYGINRGQIKSYLDKFKIRKKPEYARDIFHDIYKFN